MLPLELVPLGFEYTTPTRARSSAPAPAPAPVTSPAVPVRKPKLDWTEEVETAIREGRALPLLRLGDYVELRDTREIGRVERLDGVLAFVRLGDQACGYSLPTTRSRVRLVAAARSAA